MFRVRLAYFDRFPRKAIRGKNGFRIIISVSAVVLVAVGLPPLAAAESEIDSHVKMATRINGEISIIPDEKIAAAIAQLPHNTKQTASKRKLIPQLIDFNQWVDCFGLNSENAVFAEYVHWWDGVGQDVRLKCGTNNYGYKHIRSGTNGNNGKEQLWQNDLNYARQADWNSQAQGIESWDDLMAASIGSTVTWPDYRAVNSISKKTCGVAEIIFVNTETGKIVWTFKNLSIWSNDSDRLITSYPQGCLNCYPS